MGSVFAQLSSGQLNGKFVYRDGLEGGDGSKLVSCSLVSLKLQQLKKYPNVYFHSWLRFVISYKILSLLMNQRMVHGKLQPQNQSCAWMRAVGDNPL